MNVSNDWLSSVSVELRAFEKRTKELANRLLAIEPLLNASLPKDYLSLPSGATLADVRRRERIRSTHPSQSDLASCELAYELDRLLLAHTAWSNAGQKAKAVIHAAARSLSAAPKGVRASPLAQDLIEQINEVLLACPWVPPVPDKALDSVPTSDMVAAWAGDLDLCENILGEWGESVESRCQKAKERKPALEGQSAEPHAPPDDVAKLKAIASRVRDLVKEHPELGDEIRGSFAPFRMLNARYRRSKKDVHDDLDPLSEYESVIGNFSLPDIRTIALFRMGGLADFGEYACIVPKPRDGPIGSGGTAWKLSAWYARFPARIDEKLECMPFGEPNPEVLPPKLAERLLKVIERMVDEQRPKGTKDTTEPSPGAFLSETDIASISGVNQDTLRKRLPQWRKSHNSNDWYCIANPRPRDPRFQYRWGSVKSLVDDILSRTRGTAKVATKKK